MDQELKQRWLTALRSGDYQQGRGRLKTHRDTYCCLGVLCDVSELGEWVTPVGAISPQYKLSYEGDGPHLARDLGVHHELFGIPGEAEDKLVAMNDDDELSFPEIANWIEENL